VRGVNENDIVPLANFARERGIPVRYIELMPLGLGADFSPIPRAEIIERLQSAFGALEPSGGRLGNGPAVYYTAPDFAGKIGFISALSHKFCRLCNRLRLTGTGFLRSCLSGDTGVDMKAVIRSGGDDASIAQAVRTAVMLKPAGHDFYESSGDGRRRTKNMFRIGG
jgi:cyclic pyranopterin phosphate synthase